MAPDDQKELLFYDEAFFCRETSITRGWYRRGAKTKVSCPVSFEKIGTCGAINPRNGTLFSLIFDGFNSDTFIYYIKWLLKSVKTKKKIVLVLDNASSHKSKKVRAFIDEHKEQIELLFLPPYSPDLNPVERVWKHLRYRVTHNIYFEDMDELEKQVSRYLKEHAGPNESLKRLCCIN